MQTPENTPIVTFQGWRLAIWLGSVVLAAAAAVYVLSSSPADGARMVIRLTARTSLILFVFAFTASSLLRLYPAPITSWLCANRRYFGLAFAFSHAVHAAGIIALSQIDPVLFDQLTTPASFIAGGLGYAILLAMTTTSFDRTAALVGPRLWRIIHGCGAWFLALFFVINFGRRAVFMPGMYWPYMALIFGAIILRLVASLRNHRVSAV